MNTMPSLVRPLACARLARGQGIWRVALAAPLLLALGSAFAQAQPAAATAVAPEASAEEAQEPRTGKGDSTRAWLGAQASRKQASSTRQTLSGSVMSTVNKRYVDSFSRNIDPTPIRADMPETRR